VKRPPPEWFAPDWSYYTDAHRGRFAAGSALGAPQSVRAYVCLCKRRVTHADVQELDYVVYGCRNYVYLKWRCAGCGQWGARFTLAFQWDEEALEEDRPPA
jgi:hypothetical protein